VTTRDDQAVRATTGEVLGLQAYIGASRELLEWIAGARVLALLGAAVDTGILDALREATTVDRLASMSGLHRQAVADMCCALEAHDIVVRDGERCQLAPPYRLLASRGAAIPLSTVVRQARVMARSLEDAASDAAYTALPPSDVMAMAEGAGISALSASPHVATEVVAQAMCEIDAVWRAGARHLEVGCGIGNALLGIVATYPRVTAVGIEIDEPTATEAERRAGVLDLRDRVEVRRMDASALSDEEAFDTVQWSQFFFPTESRAVVLSAMRRALRPGGYLLMPWLGAASPDTSPSRRAKVRMALRALQSRSVAAMSFASDVLGDTAGRRKRERRAASLQTLLFHHWGVPVRSLRGLITEVRGAGFEVVRSAPMPASQFVLTRGLLLARRPRP
jgi:SAM-dependent methyltransferase